MIIHEITELSFTFTQQLVLVFSELQNHHKKFDTSELQNLDLGEPVLGLEGLLKL